MIYTRPTQLDRSQLGGLRRDVVLNSLFTSDYVNRYGIEPAVVQTFFDGYVDYIEELEEEAGENLHYDEFLAKYDTLDNLWTWAQTVAAGEGEPEPESTPEGKHATHKPVFIIEEDLIHPENWIGPDERYFCLNCDFGPGEKGIRTIQAIGIFTDDKILSDLADQCFAVWKCGKYNASSPFGYPISSLPDVIKSIMKAARTIVGIGRADIRFGFRTATSSRSMRIEWVKTEAKGYTSVHDDGRCIAITPWDGNHATQ